ncbi:MAG TPA: class I SAM-dependent methyltransferase [Candidatus Binatia bacterium]|nr:class I SAM-dependent methyltransferase [Candidatus Binatia bacterium]
MTSLRDAYRAAGSAWDRGPSRLYDELARLIVEPLAGELAGHLVLDAGAGTGALSRVLRSVGATAVALDTSADMLARTRGAATLAVVGDMLALPFLDGSFDAALAGFSISHLEAPELALAEMRRVVAPGGLVVAAVFAASPPNPAKEAIEEVAARYGFRRPGWYVTFKQVTEPRSNTPALLRACAEKAGLTRIVIEDVVADARLETPRAVVECRLGMAHMAPFVESLQGRRRAALTTSAVAEVRRRGQPLTPRVLILSSRAPD